ncbi:hypothetical protein Fcan01_24095, partial [Folsomia candida]
MHLRYFFLFFCLGLIRSSLGWNLFPWTVTSSLGNFTREKLSSLRNQRNRLKSLVIEEKRAEIEKKEEKVTLNSSLATKFSRKNFVKNFIPVNEIIEKMSDKISKRKPQSFDPRLELVDRMLKSEKMKNILNLFPIEFGIKIKKILKIDGLKNSHDDSSGINLAASRGGGGGWGWGQGMGGEIDAFTILAALAFLTFLMSVLAQLLASVTTTVAAGRSELRDVTESPVLPSGLDLDTVSRTIEKIRPTVAITFIKGSDFQDFVAFKIAHPPKQEVVTAADPLDNDFPSPLTAITEPDGAPIFTNPWNIADVHGIQEEEEVEIETKHHPPIFVSSISDDPTT